MKRISFPHKLFMKRKASEDVYGLPKKRKMSMSDSASLSRSLSRAPTLIKRSHFTGPYRMRSKYRKSKSKQAHVNIFKPYRLMGNTPLPQSFITKLKYAESFSINPAVAAVGVYSFRANDLYDPNYTGAGHQPNGFDQIMALYNHFTVIGSTIKFTVAVRADDNNPFIMGVHLDDDIALTDPGSVTAVTEQPRTNRKIVPKPEAATTKDLEVNKSFGAKQFFGVNAIVSESNYRGNASASPSEIAMYHCFIGPMDLTTDLAEYKCFVEIEYTAVFTEPKDLNQS